MLEKNIWQRWEGINLIDRDELEEKRAEKIARQNKNLHGEKGVDGLTGRWRGIFYERGVARPRQSIAPISPISMFRDRATRRLYSV